MRMNRHPRLVLRDMYHPDRLARVIGGIRLNVELFRIQVSAAARQPKSGILRRIVMEVFDPKNS